MSWDLIENAIMEKLIDEAQANTLDFIAFMKNNDFSCERYRTENAGVRFNPAYKGDMFGSAGVFNDGGFVLWIGSVECFADCEPVNSELKELAWSHVVHCPQEKHCKPLYCENSKRPWKIFGKEYESTCHAPLAFFAPDAKTLTGMKELLLLLKQN